MGESGGFMKYARSEVGHRPVAERIHDNVGRGPIDLGPEKVNVTISVGFGTIPWVIETDEEAILRAVDTALYRAKELGRDRVEGILDRDFERRPVEA